MNLEATIHDDWNPGNWLKEVSQAMEQVEKSTAENIRKDAQTLVPVDTGTLKQEIEVTKSKFEDGGYIVIAQGPGNYSVFYASYIELSTHKMAAQPYLRPALKQNQSKFISSINDAFSGD
ncbi:hypothetical protein LCGC14_2640310 [marine sediment metagenome]|uniref:HK97 gp10 family phage protein n=2 Tax=root TaxID=1 RepID=A0A0F8ZXK9_9ZZZZ